MDNKDTRSSQLVAPRHFRNLLLVAASVFAVEFVIMFLLSGLHIGSLILETFIDSTILVLVLLPVLYRLVYMPQAMELDMRLAAQTELEIAHRGLKDYAENLEYMVEREVKEARKAEEMYQAEAYRAKKYLDIVPVIIVALDAKQRLTLINKMGSSIFGYEPEQMLNRNWFDLAVPDGMREKLKLYFDEVIRQEADIPDSYESPVVTSRGLERLISWRCSYMRDKEGRPVGILCAGEDITESKRTQEALAESEKRYRLMFESNPNPMWVFDTETLAFLAVNGAAVEHYGYTKDEFLSMTIKDIRPPEDVQRLLEHLAKPFEGIDRAGIWRHRIKNGSIIDVEIATHALPFDDRKSELVLAKDVTEQMRAERKILRLNRVYSLLSKINETIVRARDKQLLFEDVCRIAVELGGFEMAWIGIVGPDSDAVKPVAHCGDSEGHLEDIGISMGGDEHGADPTGSAIREGKYFVCNDIARDERMVPWREEAIKRGYMSSVAFPLKKGDAVIGALSLYAGTSGFFTEEEIHLIGEMADDISFAIEFIDKDEESKKAEEAVYIAKQDWEDTFNTITDMVTVHDADFNIVQANKAAEKILGLPILDRSELVKCFKYYHGTACPPGGCPSCAALKTGEPSTFELFEPHLKMHIEIRAIPRRDKSGSLVGLIHVVRDISERKKAEEETRRLLESISKGKREWEMTFDSAMEFIVLVDNNFDIIRCNRSFAEFVGSSVGELAGGHLCDYLPCDSKTMDYCRERLGKGESVERMEVGLPGGKWLYMSHCPITDEHGNFIYSAVMATDITALKSAQDKLVESESELRSRVEELQKFYDMAVGRELKMKEMKKEMERLKGELSRLKGDGG